jgi:large subunit ribosomal protein L18
MRKPIGKVKNAKVARKLRRKLAIRKKVIGTAERPRVCVTKSNKNLRVQVVNDQENKVLFSVQTFGKNAVANAKANKDGAKLLGAEVAKKMKDSNIEVGVFDRNGNVYAAIIASLADSIRENGIKL